MEKIEAQLKELVMQVSRLAYAVEVIATRACAASAGRPCSCCGSTLYGPASGFAACPVCRSENVR